MTEAHAASTRFCARIIGPLMLIIGAAVIIRFDTIAAIIPALFEDAPLLFITGVFTLIVGAVLFAAHHHWTSPAAIVISLLGVLTLVRGAIFLAAPDFLAGIATQAVQAQPVGWIAGGVVLLAGLWLAYVGWLSKSA
jgi:hypothetical protein